TVPGRSNNCADCSRSFLETWYGNPQVSAPRTLDTDEHGKPDYWSPEDNANDNQIRWAGAPHTYAGRGDDPHTPARIAWDLQQAGHGAAAIVQVGWPNNGGGHAFNAVNHHGDIIWIDTQTGDVSHNPLHISNAEHVWHIPLDANDNPLHPAVPETEDSGDQNDGEAQPENSENNDGQPDDAQPQSQTQTPQNDASGDTPKQVDDPAQQPSSTEPTARKDEPGDENGRPQSESDSPSEPDRAPEGRHPSRDDSNTDPGQQQSPDSPTEHKRPSPDEGPRRDEQDRTSGKESEQPTPRAENPRNPDPRTPDPRVSDPRTPDPRTSEPHRDTPEQKHPESNDRPDGQRPDTEPRPDQKHPEHGEDPRSETPVRDRPATPDQAHPENLHPSPAEDHRDRPGRMTKDSAVPAHESLPDGRNADAAHYVKDNVNGKKPLYGDIADEHPTHAPGPAHPEHPARPAEPAGDGPRDLTDPVQRRQRDLDMLARANSQDPQHKAWFKKYYHPNSGYRRSRTNPAEDGYPVPQLHPTNDPHQPWMLANDAPDAAPESYIDSGADSGKRDEGISEENLNRLDESAKARQDAIDADRQPHRDRQAAKDAYAADKSPENKQKFDEADAKHSPLHGKMTRASEDYGEAVAEYHVMPRHFPDHDRVDDRAMGNNRFDQIWRDPDSDPPEFVVVEAKGSLTADLGERRGLQPEHASDQTAAPGDHGQEQGDAAQNEDQDGQDAPTPGVPKVRQGTRAYFETILHEMETRARRNADSAQTDADLQAAEAERKLARDLRKALKAKPCRVTYILVKGNSSGGEHQGYEMKQFDIRTEAEKESDADSAA
ncbi:MAG: hypothetical protein HOY76_24600, partial [Streptomyces sp.]|nr:hypothetical protein [Streptomyces sp.]